VRYEDADPDFSGADEAFKVLRALSFYQQYGALPSQQRAQMKDTIKQSSTRVAAHRSGDRRCRDKAVAAVFAYRAVDGKVRLPIAAGDAGSRVRSQREYVTEIEGTKMGSYIDWMRSCYFITVTALPAISVPRASLRKACPWFADCGRHQDDWGVLQIAHAFEQVNGIDNRFPAIA